MSTGSSWIATALEEYRSLRQESLQAIDRQQRILGLGTATTGLLVGLGVKAPEGGSVQATLCMVLVPLIASLVCVVWVGEMERMVRAGAHLALLERRISRRAEDTEAPLDWEGTLRREPRGRQRILPVYRAVFAVLLILATVSAGVGAEGLAGRGRWLAFTVLLAANLVLALGLTRFYIGTEFRLRALGGRRWTADTLPALVRRLGFAEPVTAAWSPAGDLLLPNDRAHHWPSPPSPRRTLLGQAVTGRYQAVSSDGADCVLSFAFGRADGGPSAPPSKSNRAIANLVARRYAMLPLIAQDEVCDALPWQIAVDLRIASKDGGYLTTREVALQAHDHMQRRGLRRAVVIAHPHHAPRVAAVCLRLGLEVAPAAELRAVGWDRDSAQWWTRSASRWAFREPLALVLHRARGWI